MLNRRLIVLFIAFTLAFSVLGLRLFKLQVADADKWQQVVRDLVHRTHVVETYRGAIRDRNLRVMARDVPSDELAIDYRAMNCDDKWLNDEAKARMVATGEWDRISDRVARLRRRDEVKADLAAKIDAIPEAIARACQIPREEVLERMHDIRSRISALKQDMWSRKKFDKDSPQNTTDAAGRAEDDTNLDVEFREIRLKEEVIAHTIRTNISPEVAHYFRQNAAEFPGLVVRDMSNRREYPFGEATAHITGTLRYVDKESQDANRFRFPDMEQPRAGATLPAVGGNLEGYLPGDRMGESGVERLSEADLRGTRGVRLIDLTDTRDSDGEVERVDPVPGRDIQLTVDAALQSDLYNALHDNGGRLLMGEDGKEHFAAIAILSMDGQVMALVSYPSYDPNRIDDTRIELSQDAWRNPLRNRAFRNIYSPGSTVKPLLAAAALTEKVIDPEEEIRCIGHFFPNRSDIFRCDAIAGHGPMTLIPAIAQSCNVYFYTVGQRLGLERLSTWYGNYGFGRETGMELAEEAGHLPKPVADADTARSESLFLGIGQGTIDVTPLQMANAYATLLRGGRIIQPRLLASTPVKQSQSFTLDPGILATVQKGMERVVAVGTAKGKFDGLPFVVAGKTGTAERRRPVFDDSGTPVEDPGRPLLNPDRSPRLKPDGTPAYAQLMDTGTDAWFVGYAPARNPRFVVAAVMEWGGHGGAHAAPMVRESFRLLQLHGYMGDGGYSDRAVGSAREVP